MILLIIKGRKYRSKELKEDQLGWLSHIFQWNIEKQGCFKSMSKITLAYISHTRQLMLSSSSVV